MLRQDHKQQLIDSAITDEVIAARGWESITAEQAEKYGFAAEQKRSGLLVPSWGPDKELKGHQLRADDPRLRDGKPVKYDTPFGQGNFLDINPLMVESVKTPGSQIFITEGAKKVDACASQGIPCIGIKGIWSWRGRNDYEATTALGDWHDIAIKNNYFFIAFDSDIRTNSKIAAAAKELKSFLDYKQAKSVKIIYLPYEGIEKKGIDDWIADKKKGLI